MRRISRVTLAFALATAAAATAPAAAATHGDGEAPRPVLSRLFERLFAPFFALGTDRAREATDPPLLSVRAAGEQDRGPGGEPSGMAGGDTSPSAPPEGEQDGGSQSDPDG